MLGCQGASVPVFNTTHGPFLNGRAELGHAQPVIVRVFLCSQSEETRKYNLILDLWLVGYWA